MLRARYELFRCLTAGKSLYFSSIRVDGKLSRPNQGRSYKVVLLCQASKAYFSQL